jgi:predicted kinase
MTDTYRTQFVKLFADLQTTPMFQRMERTVEGSPWHREANVLVHTQMVVQEYLDRTDAECEFFAEPWGWYDYLGALVCAFHDVGKPAAEKTVWSQERGEYRRYGGHELISARMFEDYATSNKLLSAKDIRAVSWMIEHHMPWSITDETKLDFLAATVNSMGENMPQVWFRALLSDQYGRISDDSNTKRRNSDEWVEQMRARAKNAVVACDRTEHVPSLWMPIAPSGAGKSTFLRQAQANAANDGEQIDVFSLDLLRHEFYDADDYAKAYEGSVKDKSFELRANARFHQMAKEAWAAGRHLYVDNTNLSAKRRGWYLRVAKKHGFHTVAVLMPVSLDTVLARQQTRGDKSVPESAVRQQYMSLQQPLVGEFDNVLTSDHNLTS